MRQIKRFVWLVALSFPLSLVAQTDTSYKGIQWTTGLSWEQIKEKAKRENKSVFVDCYATWCLPCKNMDEKTYPQEKVGNFFNDKFISVKVQMDKSIGDNDQIRSWYADAQTIMKNYGISAFPTFLFFSPSGQALHKVAGGYNAEGLIALAKDAFDPEKQYYKKLANYKSGSLSIEEMKSLARSLHASEKELSEKIAVEYLDRIGSKYGPDDLKLIQEFGQNTSVRDKANGYIHKLTISDLKLKVNQSFIMAFADIPKAKKLADKYFQKLPIKDIYTKENLSLIAAFADNSKARAFKLLYRNVEEVNRVMGFDYVQGIISNVIAKEEINPILKDAMKKAIITIDWDIITEKILEKYNNYYSQRVVFDCKIAWYGGKKNWAEYTRAMVDRLNLEAPDAVNDSAALLAHSDQINDPSFYIFQYSKSEDELKKAIYWMEQLFEKQKYSAQWPLFIDTYANLLYKVGRVKEAITWEEEAVRINPRYRDAQEALAKMQKGLITWIN